MGKKKRGRRSTGNAQDKINGQGTPTRAGIINQVKPPEPFNFHEPASWTDWIKQYKLFHSARGMSSEPEAEQIIMLLFFMGHGAKELLSSLGMTEEKRTSFESVVTIFEEHFTTTKNIFYHRAMFLERNQLPGEKIDLYINSLNKLSEKCEWSCKNCKSKDFKDEMLLLKLITGINNKSLSKHLQQQENISLMTGMKVIQKIEENNFGKVEINFDKSNHFTFAITEGKSTREPDEASGNRYFYDSGERYERNNDVTVQTEQKTSSAIGSYEESKHSNIPTSVEEKNLVDFPTLPKPSNEFDGVPTLTKPSKDFTDFPLEEFQFPPRRKTVRITKPEALAQGYSWPFEDEFPDENQLYWDLDSDDEEDFLKYLQQFHPNEYLDYSSNNTCTSVKTPPNVEDKPKSIENYHFSVSGHQSRRSLRSLCQNKLKDFKKYRY